MSSLECYFFITNVRILRSSGSYASVKWQIMLKRFKLWAAFLVKTGTVLQSNYNSAIRLQFCNQTSTYKIALSLVLLCIVFFPFWFFTSRSTIFQLCRDWSSWVEPVLNKHECVLLKDTTQWHWRGSNPWLLCLESSTLPLNRCAPIYWWISLSLQVCNGNSAK